MRERLEFEDGQQIKARITPAYAGKTALVEVKEPDK